MNHIKGVSAENSMMSTAIPVLIVIAVIALIFGLICSKHCGKKGKSKTFDIERNSHHENEYQVGKILQKVPNTFECTDMGQNKRAILRDPYTNVNMCEKKTQKIKTILEDIDEYGEIQMKDKETNEYFKAISKNIVKRTVMAYALHTDSDMEQEVALPPDVQIVVDKAPTMLYKEIYKKLGPHLKENVILQNSYEIEENDIANAFSWLLGRPFKRDDLEIPTLDVDQSQIKGYLVMRLSPAIMVKGKKLILERNLLLKKELPRDILGQTLGNWIDENGHEQVTLRRKKGKILIAIEQNTVSLSEFEICTDKEGKPIAGLMEAWGRMYTDKSEQMNGIFRVLFRCASIQALSLNTERKNKTLASLNMMGRIMFNASIIVYEDLQNIKIMEEYEIWYVKKQERNQKPLISSHGIGDEKDAYSEALVFQKLSDSSCKTLKKGNDKVTDETTTTGQILMNISLTATEKDRISQWKSNKIKELTQLPETWYEESCFPRYDFDNLPSEELATDTYSPPKNERNKRLQDGLKEKEKQKYDFQAILEKSKKEKSGRDWETTRKEIFSRGKKFLNLNFKVNMNHLNHASDAPPDGNCLLHTLMMQIKRSDMSNIEEKYLEMGIRDWREAVVDYALSIPYEMFHRFEGSNNKGKFLEEMQEYKETDNYKMGFGEAIPYLVAQIIAVPVIVVQLQTGDFRDLHQVFMPDISSDKWKTSSPLVFLFHVESEHYEGLIPNTTESIGRLAIEPELSEDESKQKHVRRELFPEHRASSNVSDATLHSAEVISQSSQGNIESNQGAFENVDDSYYSTPYKFNHSICTSSSPSFQSARTCRRNSSNGRRTSSSIGSYLRSPSAKQPRNKNMEDNNICFFCETNGIKNKIVSWF